MKDTPKSEALSSYHPVEHFYLRSFLGLWAESPDGIEIEQLVGERRNGNPVDRPYLLLEDSWNTNEYDRINNAVARLVLSAVSERLPRFALVEQDGSIETARPNSKTPRKSGAVAGLPVFLFKINWATSGPGFSWEELYHVGYVPEYDVHIVTASQDSDDVFGFCDTCIGCFYETEDFVADALEVVSEWWAGKVAEYGADEYEHLTDLGSASLEQVLAITSQVWGGGEFGRSIRPGDGTA